MSDDETVRVTKIRKFTPEEDEKLRMLVEDEKLTNWVTIASRMKNRNVHQCRDRWRQIGNKKCAKGEWTPAEDELILSKIGELGNHWTMIQKFVPQHTLAQVKARVKYLMKQSNSAYVPPRAVRKTRKTTSSIITTRSSERNEKNLNQIPQPLFENTANLIDLNVSNKQNTPAEEINQQDFETFFSDWQSPDDPESLFLDPEGDTQGFFVPF